ncbi:hypothetical protein EDD15DRAFT_2197205 [Pisolithus albus]|nr:hypothetical protein EDD15DRAFT_2197205 [Pisolithus albus]
MSTTAATVTVDLSLSWGSMLAGIFASLILYGISILQTFIYYVQYPKDRTSLKLLVVGLLLLDTLHQFLACAGMWSYLVQYYGDFTNLTTMHPHWFLSSSNHSLYGGYGHVRTDAAVPPALTNILFYSQHLLKLANASNGTAAAVDITIAAALCTLLAMGRSGFSRGTDRILIRLIVISVNSALWTALFGLLAVVFLVTLPQDMVFSGFYFPLCTLYCNTLLASLNVRRFVRGTDDGGSYQLPSMPSNSKFKPQSGSDHTTVNITMATTKVAQDSFEVPRNDFSQHYV